jgi:hypothetical protein
MRDAHEALTPTDEGLLGALRAPGLAVLLYGSYARGDATPHSDIDLLQLVEARTAHYTVGRVSVASYTSDELTRLCRGGSLFGLHLVSEGRILRDPTGLLAETLAEYRAPKSYEPVWAELRVMAQIVATEAHYLPANPEGVVRLGLYLVRTAVILRHIEQLGRPVFSIPQLASDLDLSDLEGLFDERENPSRLDWARLALARRLLARLLGCDIRNPHGSLEAFAVNTEPSDPLAARVALRLLSGERTIGYGDLLLDVLIPADE